MFDLTFNAVQHASSTVGDLRSAVNAMTSRLPTRMRCNGRDLVNDAATLLEAGIGLQCTLEISFNTVPSPTARDLPSPPASHTATGAAVPSPAAGVATPSAGAFPDKDAAGTPSSPSGKKRQGKDASAPKMRGGLFHASLSDPAGQSKRREILRSVFNTIDNNGNGVVDRDELAVYVQWASSAENSDPVHRRICALFLEDDSLERSFDRCVPVPVPVRLCLCLCLCLCGCACACASVCG